MAWKIRISVKIRGYKTIHTFTKRIENKTNDNNNNSSINNNNVNNSNNNKTEAKKINRRAQSKRGN